CAHARAEPFERLDDVEREAVVVVDHEDFAGHRDGSPAIADRIADAFRRVSCASAIGSESWTMPAPARTNAVPSLTNAERITTPVSSSPSPFSQPIAPPYGPRRVRSYFRSNSVALSLGAPDKVPTLRQACSACSAS